MRLLMSDYIYDDYASQYLTGDDDWFLVSIGNKNRFIFRNKEKILQGVAGLMNIRSSEENPTHGESK